MNISTILDKVIFPFLIAAIGINLLYDSNGLGSQSIPYKLVITCKYLIMVGMLISSRPSKDYKTSLTSFIAIIISFIAPTLLVVPTFELNFWQFFTFFFLFLYLNLLLLYSYLTLGRSLSITPTVKKLVFNGLYSQIKHPIYSIYIHLTFVFIIFFYSHLNLIIALIFAISLYFRSTEEEKLLNKSQEYVDQFKNKKMFTSVFLTPVVLISLIASQVDWADQKVTNKKLVIHFGLPAYSLKPYIYDDWGSVFIGNNIYKSFLPSRQLSASDDHIAKNLSISCLTKKKYNKNCKNVKIEFDFNSFLDCEDNQYEKDDIIKELSTILNRKNWILPNFSFCNSTNNRVCLQGSNTTDLYRKLDNLYMRFGWLHQKPNDSLFGSGSYCLKVKDRKGEIISSGDLIPKVKTNPYISFYTDAKSPTTFDISLYGQSKYQNPKIINQPVNTPIFYYMISNPKIAPNLLPWNSKKSQEIIRNFLLSKDLIYKFNKKSINLISQQPDSTSPNVSVLKGNNNNNNNNNILQLPEYLSECELLAKSLMISWQSDGFSNSKAICTNTSYQIENVVKPVGFEDQWQGFISPLTPGATGRTSLIDQYFNESSNDTWVRSSKESLKNYVTTLGMGKSFIGVDESKICNIKDNSLGIGGLVISDFVLCQD